MHKRLTSAGVWAALLLLLAACVPAQQYDALEQAYQQLKAQLSAEINADQVEITKLPGQLKVTDEGRDPVPGGWMAA